MFFVDSYQGIDLHFFNNSKTKNTVCSIYHLFTVLMSLLRRISHVIYETNYNNIFTLHLVLNY